MIVRLYHGDKTVRQDLRAAVEARNGFVLATQIQGPRNTAFEVRSPFREILESSGSSLDLIVLIDEGRPEGMWRDPLGELCDRLFTEKRDAAAATSGYVLLRAGQAMAFFRKALWDPLVDAEEITAYLARCAPMLFKAWERPVVKSVDVPPPAKPRPKPKRTPIINQAVGQAPVYSSAKTTEMPSVAPPAPRGPTLSSQMPSVVLSPELMGQPNDTDPTLKPTSPAEAGPTFQSLGDDDESTVADTRPPQHEVATEEFAIDPWMILGIHRGAPYDQVKKAYRALVQQYHPDKVSHLAPEFKKLAEDRTRELNLAYNLLQKELGVRD